MAQWGKNWPAMQKMWEMWVQTSGQFFLRSHMFVYILQFSIRNMEYFLKIIIWWFFFFFGCLFVLQHIHKDPVFKK